MKFLRLLFCISLFSMMTKSYGQVTKTASDLYYKEVCLPPLHPVSKSDTVYDRYISVNTDDVELLKGVKIRKDLSDKFYSATDLLNEESNEVFKKDGRILIRVGKANSPSQLIVVGQRLGKDGTLKEDVIQNISQKSLPATQGLRRKPLTLAPEQAEDQPQK